MRAAVTILLFVLGLFLGWHFRILSPQNKRKADPQASRAFASSVGDSPLPPPPSAADQVDIPHEKLLELVAVGRSPALSADDFLAGRTHALDWLTQWAGIGDSEKKTLAAVLLQAAQDRLAWEKANVRVESPSPGLWLLHFPGDGGRFRDDLRRELEGAFGPKTAAILDYAGDLENFFGLGQTGPEFKHGTIKIRGWRVDEHEIPNREGKLTHFDIESQSAGMTKLHQMSEEHADYYRRPNSMSRFLPLLGTREEVETATR